MILPDYNPEGRCPKCGYDTVTTRYLPTRLSAAGSYLMMRPSRKIRAMTPHGIEYEPMEPPEMLPECLLRTCVRCGHTWQENIIGVHEIDVRSDAE